MRGCEWNEGWPHRHKLSISMVHGKTCLPLYTLCWKDDSFPTLCHQPRHPHDAQGIVQMKEESRTQNTKRNIVWGVFGRLVQLIGPFIVRTLLIHNLGADYLGITSLYSAILQMLSLAELGFASAVAFSMYEPISKGDKAKVAEYLNFFRSAYRIVGLTILIIGLALMPFLSLLVEGEWPSDVNMQISFAIYLGNTSLSYFLFAYKQTLLNAYQRNDVVSKVNVASTLLLFTAQSAALIVLPNFYAYVIVMPLCTIANNVSIAIVSQKLFPEYSERNLAGYALGRSERQDIRRHIVGLLFHQICQVTRNSFDNITISMFIGLSAVAAYSNYYVVMNGVHSMLGIIGISMTASVGNSIVLESKEKNLADLRLFVFLYSMISMVSSACMICLYQPFMMLWAGESLVLPFDVAVLMTVYFYVLTMGDLRSVYVNATGIWWEQRWRALTETILNIVLNVLFIQLFGIPGVVLATIASLFVVNFVYGSHLVFKHYFGLHLAKKYYLDHLAYAVVAIVVCGVSYFLCSAIPENNYLHLAMKAIAAAGCSALLLYLILRGTKRFNSGKEFIKKLLRLSFA